MAIIIVEIGFGFEKRREIFKAWFIRLGPYLVIGTYSSQAVTMVLNVTNLQGHLLGRTKELSGTFVPSEAWSTTVGQSFEHLEPHCCPIFGLSLLVEGAGRLGAHQEHLR